MGKGNLKISLFLADDAMPAGDLRVLVMDPVSKKVLHDLTADKNGITPMIELDAPDKDTSLEPYSRLPRFSVYEVDVPAQKGYMHVIIHGVEVFDGQTSILPIQMHPAIAGDTPEQNTEEIIIPEKHGVDETGVRGQSRTRRDNARSAPPEMMTAAPFAEMVNYAEPTTAIPANEVGIPTYITVHLGSPNINKM